MSEIIITADSTCDLNKELIEKNKVKIIPLYIVYDGVSKKDGVETTPDEIYNFVTDTGNLAKTSACSMIDYKEYFEPFLNDGKKIIHISLSSGLSATCNNARLAAEELDNVYVIDSKNLSTGSGHIVIEARKLIDSGLEANEVADKLNELTARVDSSFILEQLQYLRKGGRCSAIAALGANILKLKPCIEVVDGGMEVGKKYRGNFEICLKEYIKDRLDGQQEDIIPESIFITRTKCDQAYVDIAREEIKKYMDFENVYETEAGSTIACHCGPSTLGILYIRKTPKQKS